MPSYRIHSPAWFPPPPWSECEMLASNCASSFDPGAGQLALHPGSAGTRPSTMPQSTMPHVLSHQHPVYPSDFTFSVNACGRLLAQGPLRLVDGAQLTVP